MAIEVGTIVEGIVSGITNFGAFITLPGNVVGLVHISEVADAYVKDVKDYLKEQDKVQVKVINIDPKGKIGLSIKQAKVQAPGGQAEPPPVARKDRPPARPPGPPARGAGYSSNRGGLPESFEDKLSKFIKESDQKQLEFRRSTDAKRGGRGAGRG
ncbi:MAG: S1 RNA-binding domain-containing protein [Clostridiales bacterium]|nr:S1 RNA-binding domain-containing protein [Clostridiales bacterium]